MGTQLLFWLFAAGLLVLAVYLILYRKIIMGVRRFCSKKDSLGKWRIVQTFSGKYGVIAGFKYPVKPKFDSIIVIGNFFLVKQDGLLGIIDQKGDVVLKPLYKEIYSNGDGLPQKAFFAHNIRVKNEKFEGIFNLVKREWVVPFSFGQIKLIFSDDGCADLTGAAAHILVEQDGLWGLYNINQQACDVPIEYDEASIYGYGRYVLFKKGDIFSLVRVSDAFAVRSAKGKKVRYVEGYFHVLQNKWEKLYCDMELVRKESAKKEKVVFSTEYVDAYNE